MKTNKEIKAAKLTGVEEVIRGHNTSLIISLQKSSHKVSGQ